MSAGKPTVFISYSHRDARWKERLVPHLRVLGGERDFDAWDDQRIRVGEDWKAEIERALEQASVAVLLVSVDFLDSRFIRGEEVPKLLRRRDQEKLPIVPVIVRPCTWQKVAWLGGMQVRPKGGKPLSGGSRHEIEAALARIAEEVGELIQQHEARRAARLAAETQPPPVERAAPPGSDGAAAQARVLPAEPPPSPTVVARGASEAPVPAATARVSDVPMVAAAAEPAAARSADPLVVAAAPAPSADAPATDPLRAAAPVAEARHVPAAMLTPKVLQVPPVPAATAADTSSSAARVVTAQWTTSPAPTAAAPGPRVSTVPRDATKEPVRRSAQSASQPTAGGPWWRRWGRRRVALLAIGAPLALAAGIYAGARMRGPAHVTAPEVTPTRSEPISVPLSSRLPEAPPGADLEPFEFDTVTVDGAGIERERRKLQAISFKEDLGGGVTLEMVAIPGGEFTMGAPASETESLASQRPQHTVTVAPFFIGRFEVTQAQWRAVAALPQIARPLDARPSGFEGDTRPVEQVTWNGVVEFCARLTRKTGRTYRLPSEAEWEYAARAETDTPFAFGPTITPVLVNYDGNYPYGGASKGRYRAQSTAVGSLGFANAFGLFDIHGNVWEWTQDVWHDHYRGAPSDGSAWETGGDPARRVLRGGAWFDLAWNCRSAVRYGFGPENGNLNLGFRVVCAVSRTQS